jgi:hypothetical protein
MRTCFLHKSKIGQFHLDGCRDRGKNVVGFNVAMN